MKATLISAPMNMLLARQMVQRDVDSKRPVFKLLMRDRDYRTLIDALTQNVLSFREINWLEANSWADAIEKQLNPNNHENKNRANEMVLSSDCETSEGWRYDWH
jgi:hypothetical protein